MFHNFINGEYMDATGGKTFAKRSPVDNSLPYTVSEAGQSEVDAAVGAARNALNGEWGNLSTEQRVDLLYGVANEITRRFDDFVEAEMADTGQHRHVMENVSITRGAANFKVFAETFKSAPCESFQTATPEGRGAINYSIRVPKGAIAVICPWNAPFMLMTWKVAPALACRNTVVVKPSEETPATANLPGEVMNTVGVPRGGYNVVHGFGPGSAGEFLAQHPGIDAITFTGDTRTGAAIMKSASEGIRDVSFELGGKNAGIVFADADFDAAVDGRIYRAAFLNSGQICLSTERVYVERPIFERFVIPKHAISA